MILLPLPRGTFFSPASLLNVAETLVAIRTPGPSQGCVGDTAGNPNCASCSCILGQSSQQHRAGLLDPGVDQQFDLWSVSKENSILLTDFKLMHVLALLFAISSLPSLALFLVNTVPFYLAPSLCISPSSVALLLILPPFSFFSPLPCPAGPDLAHLTGSPAGASSRPGSL